MSEIYINSSGNYNEFVNGELQNEAAYNANYDGDILNLAVKNNDQEYYTRLGNDELLSLLDMGLYPMDRDDLIIRLQSEFPLKKTNSKSKKKSKKGKKKEHRLTKREKLNLIETVF